MEEEKVVNQDGRKFTPQTDGFIWLAEPYPENDEILALQLMYTEDVEKRGHTIRKFYMKREDAKLLAKMLNEVLSAASVEAAWNHIAAKEAHEDPDFDSILN